MVALLHPVGGSGGPAPPPACAAFQTAASCPEALHCAWRRHACVALSTPPPPSPPAFSGCSFDNGPGTLAVDSLGFVCPADQLASNGCCNANSSDAVEQYTCAACGAEECCEGFEACVSCCMKPSDGRQPNWFATTLASRPHSELYSAHAAKKELTTFHQCVLLCRHSSRALTHENAYRSARHHCYGSQAPPLS